MGAKEKVKVFKVCNMHQMRILLNMVIYHFNFPNGLPYYLPNAYRYYELQEWQTQGGFDYEK